MLRRVEDPRAVIISPLSIAGDAGLENREEIEKHRKLLIALFAAYPNRNYFNAFERYRVGDTIIQLRQPLLKRNKFIDGMPTPITKYDVLGVELAHGSFGVVYPVTGTLTLQRNNLTYHADGNHVVKLSANFNTYFIRVAGVPPLQPSTLDETLAERRAMEDVGRFNPKKEVSQQIGEYETLTFITTRRFTGEPLSNIIKHERPSIEKRLRLTIALLRALKEQIIDKDIIHRDIKPENIIVDLETMEVNIIDVGLSTSKTYPAVNVCGTPGYIAPEIFSLGRINEKVDIFSMSRTLAGLWGEDLRHWKLMRTWMLLTNSENFNFDASQLFKYPKLELFTDVTPDVQKFIANTLAISSSQNPVVRADISELIERFESLYIAVKHNKVNQNKDNAAFIRKLFTAFKVGYDCRPVLLTSKSGTEFIKAFDDALAIIEDHKPTLDEFIHGLGWHSLNGVGNKFELRERVLNTVRQYRECAQRYLEILEEAETIRNKLIVRKTVVSNELDEFILEITHKLTRINDKPFDLDFLQKSIERLNQDANNWRARLNELQNSERYQLIKSVVEHLALPQDEPRPVNHAQVDAARLEPPEQQPNQQLPPLEILKLNLMYAIRKYVRDTTTDESIDMKKRAASKHRKTDIDDLTKIINVANTPEELLKKTKARLGKMRYSLFGRSELRRNLEAVIEQYNAVTKIKK